MVHLPERRTRQHTITILSRRSSSILVHIRQSDSRRNDRAPPASTAEAHAGCAATSSQGRATIFPMGHGGSRSQIPLPREVPPESSTLAQLRTSPWQRRAARVTSNTPPPSIAERRTKASEAVTEQIFASTIASLSPAFLHYPSFDHGVCRSSYVYSPRTTLHPIGLSFSSQGSQTVAASSYEAGARMFGRVSHKNRSRCRAAREAAPGGLRVPVSCKSHWPLC